MHLLGRLLRLCYPIRSNSQFVEVHQHVNKDM